MTVQTLVLNVSLDCVCGVDDEQKFVRLGQTLRLSREAFLLTIVKTKEHNTKKRNALILNELHFA